MTYWQAVLPCPRAVYSTFYPPGARQGHCSVNLRFYILIDIECRLDCVSEYLALTPPSNSQMSEVRTRG